MSLCINPHCQKSENPDNILFCQNCGSELLLEGRYRAMRRLGGGGFGVTYEVSEVHSNIPKVLKVLMNNQPKAVELFEREAKVLALLNHPGIPKVESNSYFVYFPKDSQQPLHCLVMEKVEGLDLYEYMRRRDYRPINQKLAVQWLTEIVTILQQVHSQNFFHRDIKPPNIMLRADGRLVLIDFGTARALTQTYWSAQSQGNVTGVISAGYTPTEQMSGQAVPQSDFFALGRTFVYLLTGKEPTDPVIFDSYNNESRWRSHTPNILPTLADLIDQMMAHLPSQRPANTQDILQRLAAIDQALNPPQRPSTPIQPVNTPGVAPTQPVRTPPGSVSSSAVTQPANIGWDFSFQWVLATAVGIAMGFAVYSAMGSAVFGIPVGIMQCLVLRRRIYQAVWWIFATAVGTSVGSAVGNAVGSAVGNNVALPVFGVVVGTTVGIMQWLVLRRQISQAGWWILANVIGGAVLGAVFNVVGGSASFSVISVLVGLIIGLVLVWLLRHPVSKP